ncbi:hypothetical protein FHR84_001858 [Actinopolyspora biskrensis]|uniref:Uncharacterized protein n=1 Tax=Actinopolyspora biskrensis TaxID=1470178 RepID=A0A852Z8T2_9ACTN|nr:hypothetical protein [Actinopolyspora biskrensis]NYH78533.1 hypothetical protein [Actinopolyspora biskrensis]
MALVNERVAEGVETLVARQGYGLADGRDEISAAESEAEQSRRELEREAADRKQRVLEQSRQAVADAEKDRGAGAWEPDSGKSSNELQIGVVEDDEDYAADHLSGGHERTPASAAQPPAEPPAAPAPPRRRRSFEDDWDDEEDFSQRSWLQ